MTEIKRTLLECVLLCVVGVIAGLSANAMNPDGLILTKDYFAKPVLPAGPTTRPVEVPGTQPADDGTNGNADNTVTNSGQNAPPPDGSPSTDAVIAFLQGYDLQPIMHDDVLARLTGDPHAREGLYVVIDARDKEQYAEGHIPGAYQLDHYRMERYAESYIEAILEACAGAEIIIVYCNGGKCEDSVFTAGDLLDQGVDPNRMFIYVGGFQAWVGGDMPVEMGERLSGQITMGVR